MQFNANSQFIVVAVSTNARSTAEGNRLKDECSSSNFIASWFNFFFFQRNKTEVAIDNKTIVSVEENIRLIFSTNNNLSSRSHQNVSL